MSDIKHVFETDHVDMSDGSGTIWEVVTPTGERIGSFEDHDTAKDFEIALNMLCTSFAEKPGAVINS